VFAPRRTTRSATATDTNEFTIYQQNLRDIDSVVAKIQQKEQGKEQQDKQEQEQQRTI
jgi:hypothetical protein